MERVAEQRRQEHRIRQFPVNEGYVARVEGEQFDLCSFGEFQGRIRAALGETRRRTVCGGAGGGDAEVSSASAQRLKRIVDHR
jgi:hypothetical protein